MRVLKYSIIFLFFINPNLVISQSFIGLSAGIEYADLSATENNHIFFQVNEPFFRLKGYSIGVNADHFLKNSIYLAFGTRYIFPRKVNATDIGFIPYDYIELRNLQSKLILNWILYDNINAGVGIGHNYMFDVNKFRDGEEINYLDSRHELGITYTIGYFHKNFHIALSFYDGIKALKKKGNMFKPINSLNLSVSYMLNASKKFNKRKVNCPRL